MGAIRPIELTHELRNKLAFHHVSPAVRFYHPVHMSVPGARHSRKTSIGKLVEVVPQNTVFDAKSSNHVTNIARIDFRRSE
jgi:hypothetical protein